LRPGTSFVDGCQRREHLALRLGTSCIDCRLVLHPVLRLGASFVDGCQRREHLALRLGTSCIDCRLVCTPSCDWAPRLSTGVNAVSTWPCGWAPRALTAGRSATGLATRCSQRCLPTRTVLRQSDWETVSPLDAILRRTLWLDVDPDSIQPALANRHLSLGSWTLLQQSCGSIHGSITHSKES
jgi:hypothetical protein